MAGNPLPIFMECGCHIAPFGRSDMNSFSIAHKIVNLVRQAENLIIICAHALNHHVLIDTNHMSMANIEFLYEERKEWKAESDFTWFCSCNIKTDSWPALKQVITQFVGKCSKRARPVMLKEAYAHIGVPVKGSYSYTARDTFTLIISNNEDP